MPTFQRFYKFLIGLAGCGLLPLGYPLSAQASPCSAVLSQVISHQIEAGETLDTIAQDYGLLPETITAMNPTISSQGALPVGNTINISPFNGLVVQVATGQTWQSLAESYDTRADLLFELNGCPSVLPTQVFIPGNYRVGTATPPTTLRYPLPTLTQVILSYGWQPHPSREELVFNSGIALASTPGTAVTAAAAGTVAFAGERNGAMMVVLNHRDGLQTRYGNLNNVVVSVGDRINVGAELGTVTGATAESFMYFEVRTNSADGWVARDPGLYLAELDLQQ